MAKNKKTTTTKATAEETPKDDAGGAPVVASDAENANLVHTDEIRDQASAGPAGATAAPAIEEGHSATTRDDRTDLGAPMLPGSPDEPQGPEDALGTGPKRGDYTERLGGDGYHPHEGSEPQRPRAADIGDAEGVKGGVDTTASS